MGPQDGQADKSRRINSDSLEELIRDQATGNAKKPEEDINYVRNEKLQHLMFQKDIEVKRGDMYKATRNLVVDKDAGEESRGVLKDLPDEDKKLFDEAHSCCCSHPEPDAEERKKRTRRRLRR